MPPQPRLLIRTPAVRASRQSPRTLDAGQEPLRGCNSLGQEETTQPPTAETPSSVGLNICQVCWLLPPGSSPRCCSAETQAHP